VYALTRATRHPPTLDRPAFVRDIFPEDNDEEGMRAQWRDRFGIELPRVIPCFFQVSQIPDADPEDCVLIPSCCVWRGDGFVPVPLEGGAADAIEQQV